MSTIEQYKLRVEYDDKLSNEFFNQNFVDFNGLNRYGMVDPKNNLIYPRSEKMKPFGKSGDKKVLSFVSVAYEAMVADLQKRIRDGKWENNSIFTTLIPKVAYTDPVNDFDEFMTSQFQNLSPSVFKNKKVKDFASYLAVFQDYLASVKYNFPFTFTGFLERNNDPSSTGLQIEFIENQKNNIDLKSIFAGDIAFKRYLLLTERHGFLVNRNTPWVIMANIDSPAMQVYASQDAGINIGTAGILKRYYDPASPISYKFFVDYLVGGYNAVATSEPKYEYLETVPDGCKPYRKITINRTPATDFAATQKENEALLKILYLTIRYYENFSDKQKLKQVLRTYREELKVNRYSFSELVEVLVGPAKNSSVLFYQLSGATSTTSFEYSFEADEFAGKIGCVGSHQMPNGRFMPCKTHEEYISLTSR